MNYCETLKYLNDYVKQEIKEIMKKDIFKVGDKVYHIQYGWGVITEKDDTDIKLKFGEHLVWTGANGNLLSFTEYTLQGFSQERPIELPEVGDLCLVRDNETHPWKLREFEFEHNGSFFVKSLCGSTDGYVFLKRIKILD